MTLVTLPELRGVLDDATAKISEVVRFSNVSGIATVWVLRVPAETGATIPRSLLIPLALFGISLLLDLFQYVAIAIGHFRLIRSEEKERQENDEFRLTPSILIVPYVFFVGKGICSVCGYVFLGWHLWNAILTSALPE